MFSTQDSVDFGPAVLSVGYPQESNSPVRKKGRSRNFGEPASSRDGEGPNPFGFSQDSFMPSQFSQNFADRLGQLNMFCSQDNSNISGPETAFPPTFPTSALTTDNTLVNAKTSGLSTTAKNSAKAIPAPAVETERAIDVAPPVKNTFLAGAMPHCELYFDPAASCDQAPVSKKARRAVKVWIGAFTERPRILTEFEELRMLGEGTFSTVMCVRHRLDGTLYAVKRVREGIATERQGHLLLREVNALAALQGCPHIVRYYNSWIDSHHLFIQTELCHLGSLEDLIAPRPAQSSIMHTAAVALTALLTGSHLSGTGRVAASSSHDRNRSESFNSIDLTQADQLLDECLTAPGPSGSASASASAAGLSAAQQAARAMLPPVPSQIQEDSNSGGMMFATQQTQSQDAGRAVTGTGAPAGKAGSSSQVCRGVQEDLAWLVLYDVSLALKYMHEREMAHLDLRPANIFLTTAAGYRYQDMDAADPQRLQLLVAQGYNACLSSGSGSGGGGGAGERPLFASILSAAPLQAHQNSAQPGHGGGGGGGGGGGRESNEFDQYDVRREVERLLVQRRYEIRVGDLGHCCRVDDRSAIQEGQTRYCARELINMEEEFLDVTRCDVFSLGASVYELCLGRFLGADGEQGIAEWHSIRDGQLDSSLSRSYSPALVEVLQLLMHPEPSLRPTAAALATHLLRGKYPFAHDAGRVCGIFPPASLDLEEQLAQLRRENAALRAKASGAGSN